MSADPNPEIVAPGILGRILAVYGRTHFLRYLIFSGLAAATKGDVRIAHAKRLNCWPFVLMGMDKFGMLP